MIFATNQFTVLHVQLPYVKLHYVDIQHNNFKCFVAYE
jgi:hypothetical protein